VVLSILIISVLVLALFPLVYYLLSLCCVITHFSRLRHAQRGTTRFLPPASIIKAVRGVDHEAYDNFASFCRLDYPEYEIVFAVADKDDQVIPIIEKLRADFPQHSIRLITNVPHLGANHKINSLCQLAQEAKYDLLVMSDSDVRVGPDYLKTVVAPFADRRVGVVTALYKSLSAGNVVSKLDALGMYMDSAPAALVAKKVEGRMGFAFGWTMATSKKFLSEIGGWEAMVNHHSDDFELGRRVAECGHRVELISKPVTMVFPNESLREYFRHELRWSIGLKSVRPLGYWGLTFTHGLPWALLGAAISVARGSAAIAAWYLLAYLVLRIGLTWTTGSWGLRDRELWKILWLVPVRDALSFVVWITGFFSDEITWRGLGYRVRKGLLFPILSSSRTTTSSVGIGFLNNQLSTNRQNLPRS
jgi:ceramide glucosyltransferase